MVYFRKETRALAGPWIVGMIDTDIRGRDNHVREVDIRYQNHRIGPLHLEQPRAWELYLAYPLGASLPGPIEDYFGNFTDRYLIDDFPTNPQP